MDATIAYQKVEHHINSEVDAMLGMYELGVVRTPDFGQAWGVALSSKGLRLMTLRSEGQFNTVVYEEEDLYRGITRRDVVMMAESDGASLGLGENDLVDVTTETGTLRVAAAFIDIPPGNLAMYYPEANALVPRRVDKSSGTPAFKSIVARLAPVRG